ncbi:MAG: hypothetical protein JO033_27355 [Acidobacteriaceae bacterium]|nr:hypothetical protein [Acidobacteriaceae bacterium]
MPSSTAKRVVLYRFDRQPLEGIVNPAAFLLPERVELITLGGSVEAPAYSEFKAICFVSDTAKADLFSEHNFFERRPKVPGLWTRFTFRDGDKLDGILSHNLLDWPQFGFFITPPRAGANRQRVFIPRAALEGTELRGVVGSGAGSAKAIRKLKAARTEGQLNMFDS